MLAEWKNTALPSKFEVEGAITGIEHVIPGCRMSARGHGRLGAGVILQHSNKLVWKNRGQHPMNWRASVLQWHRSTDGVNRAALGNVSSMWLDFVPHQEYKTT